MFIALALHDRHQFTAELFALWQAGHVVVLPPNTNDGAISKIEKSIDLAEFIHDEPGRLGHLRSGARVAEVPAWGDLHADPDTLACIVFSSGSTGDALRCDKTFGQLFREVETLSDTFQINADHRFYSTVPAHHIYGLLFSVLLPYRNGATTSRTSTLLPMEVASALIESGATHLVTVPAHLQSIVETGQLPKLPQNITVFCSGAPLSSELAARTAARFGWNVIDILGSSETGGLGYRYAGKNEPSYRPFAGVHLTVSETGVSVVSPHLPNHEPISIADNIALQSDGTFVHHGRRDRIIKVGGTRVSLTEIERAATHVFGGAKTIALAQSRKGPAQASAVQREGSTDGQLRDWEIWLVIEREQPLSVIEVRQKLAPELHPLALPRRVRVVSKFPVDDRGKVTDLLLRDLFSSPNSR